jgi:mycothiol synthase
MTQAVITTADELDAGDRERLSHLVADATLADGFSPLNEQSTLHLTGRHPGVTHLLARLGADVVAGYAQVELAPGAASTAAATVELVVSTQHRRRGIGTTLVDRALTTAAGRAVQVWAHGTTPAAEAFAGHAGFEPVRRLLRLSRPIDDRQPLTPPGPAPDGMRIRTFVPGQDEAAWLRVNAAAFAAHPEQGRWTGADLADREIEGWFDPAGFFLAETTAEHRVVGFHWTKQDGGVGEVYVLGIDPSAQGSGLGRVLLRTGLAYLRSRGCSVVDLYVEADNVAARHLYEREGFAVHVTDTMYRRNP